MIARLIVSYELSNGLQRDTIGVDIPGYERLSAQNVITIILAEISKSYTRDVSRMVTITNIVELAARTDSDLTAARPWLSGYRAECKVCGQENGHGGLQCPNMKPMA